LSLVFLDSVRQPDSPNRPAAATSKREGINDREYGNQSSKDPEGAAVVAPAEKATVETSRALGIDILPFEVHGPADLGGAVPAAAKERVGAPAQFTRKLARDAKPAVPRIAA